MSTDYVLFINWIEYTELKNASTVLFTLFLSVRTIVRVSVSVLFGIRIMHSIRLNKINNFHWPSFGAALSFTLTHIEHLRAFEIALILLLNLI